MIFPIRLLLAAYWLLVLVLAGVISLVGLLLVIATRQVSDVRNCRHSALRRGIAPPVRWPEKVGTDWTDEEADAMPEGLGPRIWACQPGKTTPFEGLEPGEQDLWREALIANEERQP